MVFCGWTIISTVVFCQVNNYDTVICNLFKIVTFPKKTLNIYVQKHDFNLAIIIRLIDFMV